ncbi:lasso RiPP family leader peptide-containing protein [bacterium]|nr:lasso RiPP family leader peptide-containing protein [bacterium]
MNKVEYSKPTIEQVATFKDSTNGLWTGRFRDVFGGRALIQLVIRY